MTTRRIRGGLCSAVRTSLWALAVVCLAGCRTAQGPDQAVMDSLAEMEIRIRLLQSELTDMRHGIAARDERRDMQPGSDELLQARLDDLGRRIAALPEQLSDMCPAPPESATVNTQCDPRPDVQRVVVSGDKLVVGELERVWVEPPSASLVARIDPAMENSLLHAVEVVEFERDGNRWVRFDLTVNDQPVSVERPVKRFSRVRDARRPIVELRVQLGDVRESVEFALMELTEAQRSLVLGRNFLTDVALVDVARKYVQPAFEAPGG